MSADKLSWFQTLLQIYRHNRLKTIPRRLLLGRGTTVMQKASSACFCGTQWVISLIALVFRWDYHRVLSSQWDQRSAKSEVIKVLSQQLISNCVLVARPRRCLTVSNPEWRLISATLCGWRCCFMADQLWFITHIREEEASCLPINPTFSVSTI